MNQEIDRIKRTYKHRIQTNPADRYSLFRPGELYMMQRREQETLELLRRCGIHSCQNLRILEVGCGRGARLADWARWGAPPTSLYGVDLMDEFVEDGRKLLPTANLRVASGDHLPFEDGFFDIVVQLTVFSSVLDQSIRRRIATEMQRVVAPNGLILWYDFRYPSPGNKAVSPVRPREVRSLFPNWHVDGRTITLLPPMARRLAPLSFVACRALEVIPLLRSHYLAAIRRKKT